MPYKSVKIIIAGTKYDRRKKLDKNDKLDIKALHKKGMAIRQISRLYPFISRRLIQFIIYPERLKIVKQRAIEVKRWEKYNRKEYHTPAIRKHRRYKQKLYKEGKIK